MTPKRPRLYERLPEIYRIKDEEQLPAGQLKSYLGLVEDLFGEIRRNIEDLYEDLFIESCDDWVIPYLGDLVGNTPLKGEPWSLRADVADTIKLRRRKGTAGAIERLTYDLSSWGVHCRELRENLAWNQHLNHQRPDLEEIPPCGDEGTRFFVEREGSASRFRMVRGGTVTLRDPAALSLLGSPFDPAARTADLRPPERDRVRPNLPNLAVYLWTDETYTLSVLRPETSEVAEVPGAVGESAGWVFRFSMHPLDRPLRLYQRSSYDPDADPPVVTLPDRAPGPVMAPRLNSHSPAGRPELYVRIFTVDFEAPEPIFPGWEEGGQIFYLPASDFPEDGWSFRGADLCAFEEGVAPPIRNREILIDPCTGRVAVGVESEAGALALQEKLRYSCTYGAPGPVGAHPISRAAAESHFPGESPVIDRITFDPSDPDLLKKRILEALDRSAPTVIEIMDSALYDLNFSGEDLMEGDRAILALKESLVIRGADLQRPHIRLAQPLRFRPYKLEGVDEVEQESLRILHSHLTVELEGIYLTRSDAFPADRSLIEGAALQALFITDSTLDPGGYRNFDFTRAEFRSSLSLEKGYGLTPEELPHFEETPEIRIRRSITGCLSIDSSHTLQLSDSLIDGGSGTSVKPEEAREALAGVSSTSGPPAEVQNVTFLGRVSVESLEAEGGIWVHSLDVYDRQKSCIRLSYLSGMGDNLPRNYGCLFGPDAKLHFMSETFEDPLYGRLEPASDFGIRERGPDDNAMGVWGFLKEASKIRNISIRYREFMPVGIRPILIFADRMATCSLRRKM